MRPPRQPACTRCAVLQSWSCRPRNGRARQRRGDTGGVEHLAAQLAAVPGVVAVTLGGSRATNTAVEGSDWDFGLYYRNGIDPAEIAALGWPGRVFAPGEWGRIVNGGAWLTIGGTKVDLIYRDLDEVLHWTVAAEDGRFEIQREVGYVAVIATYVLAGELALGKVLAGDLPRPRFPQKLRQTAPTAWFRLAARALHFAEVHAGRRDPGRLPGEPLPSRAGRGPRPSGGRQRMGAQREAACGTGRAGRRSGPARTP
jgi:hypothetical protein